MSEPLTEAPQQKNRPPKPSGQGFSKDRPKDARKPNRYPGRRLTKAQKNTIEALAMNQVPKTSIAEVVDCGEATVYRHLNRPEMREKVETARSILGNQLPTAAMAYKGRIHYELKKPSANPIASGAVLRGLGVLMPDQQVNVGVFQLDTNTAAMLLPAGQDDSNLLQDAPQPQLEAPGATNGAELAPDRQAIGNDTPAQTDTEPPKDT